MKILIIGFAKFRYMPYLTFYLNAINKEKNDVDIIYWDRDGKEDSAVPNYTNNYKFNYKMRDDISKVKKIPAFLKFRRFAKAVINKGNYDFIIVLHTLPAVLISDILINKYRERFILDYRDYTFEKIKPYKNRIAKLVYASALTFTSSNAFRKYLPESEKIFTSHNILPDSLEHRKFKQEVPDKIRIRYWGQIRYAQTNIKIISKIKNDPRFEMHFHGRQQSECQQIIDYCRDNGVENVYFHGEYNAQDRYEFAEETDLIQNVQDFDNITVNAVSNKFYDGAIFYIPQICSDRSYMGECLDKYGIGLSCNVDDEQIAEKIYSYVTGLDRDEFRKNCNAFVEKIVGEYLSGLEKIKNIFDS